MDSARLTVEDNTARLAPTEITYAWHLLEPLLQASLDRGHGEIDISVIHTGLINGALQLWVGYDGPKIFATCVTEVVVFPNYKVLRVVLLAGKDLGEWAHLEALLEGYARSQSCAFIEGWARPGMAKVASRYGYEAHYVVIRKPVARGLH